MDFRYVPAGIEELLWRQGRYGEFDAAEFSFGAYLASVEDPDRLFDAIPVFPSRHSGIRRCSYAPTPTSAPLPI
ncbi:MAG: hypothetical protein M3492_14030 [Actinomycetota bacterium]|nr:hypothetical protein [Actinomycetota bacterium]